jgi:hypothetical protein
MHRADYALNELGQSGQRLSDLTQFKLDFSSKVKVAIAGLQSATAGIVAPGKFSKSEGELLSVDGD